MKRNEFIKNYWSYYLMLEKQVLDTFQYVDLVDANMKTTSNMYSMLIQVIGDELDAMFKQLCNFAPSDRKTIADYANYLIGAGGLYKNIKQEKIQVLGLEKTIQPFKNWNISKPGKSLIWWEAFDGIKHSRVGNKKESNLKNVLYLLATLYLIEMKYLAIITDLTGEPDIPDEESRLFAVKKWDFRAMSMRNALIGL